MSRVLLDFIRDESTNHRNQHSAAAAKSTSKGFGSSSGPVPASDVPMRSATSKAQISRHQSSRFHNVSDDSPGSPSSSPYDERAPADIISPRRENAAGRGQMTRMLSSRAPKVTFNLDEPMPEDSPPRQSRRPGTGFSLQREKLLPEEDDDDDDEAKDGGDKDKDEEKGGGGEEEEETAEEPVRMSLMDLLGRDGPTYGEGGYDDDEEEEEEEEEVEEEEGGREEEDEEGSSGQENTCCVCMVTYKGTAMVPCGHTFCKLCSRELWVGKGNCPACNGFVMEILEIF